MNFLLKPNQFCKHMSPCSITADEWLHILHEPPVFSDKTRAPLAIYGTMADQPEPVSINGAMRPRCTGENIKSIFALQLDIDNGLSIKEFCDKYARYRFTLYTSYSYGFKPNDRYRVVLPLATPMPCHLLQNRRVKNNLKWNFYNVDECCFDRGHWQILPCIRSKGAPYYCFQNKDGELWGGDDYWAEYERWIEEDRIEFERRAEKAKELTREVNVDELLIELEGELNAIPVGQGQRYAAVKRLLAKYVHKGVGEAIISVPCPWHDKKWERQWPGLVNWASTIV